MIKKKYSHQIKEIVKFHEVDSLGVCNNAVYFNYFEDARIKYLQDLSAKYKFKKFLIGESFFIMVHNEIDYINSARFDDVLNVYTRVDKVSNSSFSFDHFIERADDKAEIARGAGVVVHINKITKKSIPLPEEFHQAIMDFEHL